MRQGRRAPSVVLPQLGARTEVPSQSGRASCIEHRPHLCGSVAALSTVRRVGLDRTTRKRRFRRACGGRLAMPSVAPIEPIRPLPEAISDEFAWGLNLLPGIGDALDRSMKLQPTRFSESPSIQQAVDVLYDEMSEFPALLGRREGPAKTHLNLVLSNLHHWATINQTVWIRHPGSPGAYKHVARYHPFGYSHRFMTAVVDALRAHEMIDYRRGWFDRTAGRGRTARIKARPGLIHRLETEFGVTATDTNSLLRQEPIILKDSDKRPIAYNDTDETERMRNHLHDYNALLARHRIGLDVPPRLIRWMFRDGIIDYSQTVYHRVFNNDLFEEGGRFYGPWWQNISKELREHLLIDGSPTIELDYSAMHIHLAYSALGLNYWELPKATVDPYAILDEAEAPRKAMKIASLTALNAANRKSAISAINKELRNGDFEGVRVTPSEILDAFRARHPRLGDMVYAGAGTRLQFNESRITEYITSELIRMGIPALNIHDGYVVESQYEPRLRFIMEDSFSQLGFRSVPRISP